MTIAAVTLNGNVPLTVAHMLAAGVAYVEFIGIILLAITGVNKKNGCRSNRYPAIVFSLAQ
jgi:hypothetical protein